MGFFSKLGHGGVKVQVQAPSSIARNQIIPVTVNISSDSTHTVKSVRVEIQAEAREQGITLGNGNMNMNVNVNQSVGGVGVQDSRTLYQTISQVENRDEFVINSGETKPLNFQLYIDAADSPNQANANAGGVVGVLQVVANVASDLAHVNYLYRVHATAVVDGVMLNPSDSQSIQILPAQGSMDTPQSTINNFQAGGMPTQQVVTPEQAPQMPIQPLMNTVQPTEVSLDQQQPNNQQQS
ncbi:MAG TPA: hypothetical protein VFN31_02790 [Candidatus Saccharimonadales bacterium]|nr:hypothetical protein [Candidatus Saccharimonadales bacterium]